MKVSKHILFLAFLMLLVYGAVCQAPMAFKYQAIARDRQGNLLSNQKVSLLVELIRTSESGEMIYSETHHSMTNEYGLINIEIGGGKRLTGDFKNIDWGADNYYIQISIDLYGGESYSPMGVSQLLSVPYAFYASESGNSGTRSGEWDHIPYSSVFLDTDFNDANVGIGITTPGGKLHVAADGFNSPAAPILFVEHRVGYTSTFRRAVNNAGNALFLMQKARGTMASPAAVQMGDNIGQIRMEGYAGSGYFEAGYMRVLVDDAPASGSIPGALVLATTPSGSANSQERMRITSDGNVGIGTIQPKEKLEIEGNAMIDTVYTEAVAGNSPLHLQTDGITRVFIEEGRSGVGVNTTSVDSSALLELESTEKGFLPPRMTTSERDAIMNPAQGLIIFNQDCQCINFFDGDSWVAYGEDPNLHFECGGNFVDNRDGKTYQTVQIGNQCWMGENLNLGTKINGNQGQSDNDIVEKFCYGDIPSNCTKYGGLYQWDEMMQYDTNRYNAGICPEDWRLPTVAEWDTLINSLGGGSLVGTALKEEGTSGFEALLGGQRKDDGSFADKSGKGMFWTATQISAGSADYGYVSSGDTEFHQDQTLKTHGLAIRCIQGLPNRVDTGVIVIDTLVYELISDSNEMAEGIFRYNILVRDEQEVIVQDNIIIGETEGGYVRRVTDTIFSENQMILLTEQATMEDIWESAEFADSTGIAGDPQPRGDTWSYTSIDYLAKGVSLGRTRSGFRYDFNAVTLYDEGGINLSIPDGYVELDPKFKFDFKFKARKIKKLGIRTDNARFTLDFNVQLNAAGEAEVTYKKKLASTTHTFRFFVGWLPVWIKVKTNLMVYDTIGIDALFTATTGYTNSTYMNMGVVYENNNWRKIWNTRNEDAIHPLTISGEVNLGQRFSIVPEISMMVYGAAGPFFNIELYEKFEANLILPEAFWDMELGIGANANVGAEIKAFGKVARCWYFIKGPYKPLWMVPGKLLYVSGNNQEGNPGQELAEPIKVKVTDNLGNAIPMVSVTFEVTAGAGSVADTTVFTDTDGFAETTWTLDTVPGLNKVRASVFNTSGAHINGSPFEFITMAWSGCPGIPTVEYGEQTYHTVLIGEQCWLRENLNIGTMIGGGFYMGDNEIIEKWCYNGIEDNCNTYGGLYQWDEVMQYSTTPGVKGICPAGFHVPDSSEWVVLRMYLGGGEIAGGKMKETGFSHWSQPNTGATNSSGFTGLPAGYYSYWTESFEGLNHTGTAWSSTESPYNSENSAGGLNLDYLNDNENGYSRPKWDGASVRCLKDEQPPTFSCGDDLIDTRDSKTYSTVEIGSQCWMAENLNVGVRIDGINDQTETEDFEKYCYDDLESNCDTYGGLYQWDEAMDYSTIEGGQGICPAGWHLPTDEEWKQLEGEVDSEYDYPDSEWDTYGYRGFDAGHHLKATTGYYTGNGDDSFGFTALPGGIRHWDGGAFMWYQDGALFWTSSFQDSNLIINRTVAGSFGDVADRALYHHLNGLSVRCLKN